jgi:hypothetical protein
VGHSPAPHLVRSKQRLVAPKQDFNRTSSSCIAPFFRKQPYNNNRALGNNLELHGVLDGTQDCRWQKYLKIVSWVIPKDKKLEQYLVNNVEQINHFLASYSSLGMLKGHLAQHVS